MALLSPPSEERGPREARPRLRRGLPHPALRAAFSKRTKGGRPSYSQDTFGFAHARHGSAWPRQTPASPNPGRQGQRLRSDWSGGECRTRRQACALRGSPFGRSLTPDPTHRFRDGRLWRSVPAEGRQTASLSLHDLRGGHGQDRCRRKRHRGHGRLQPPLPYAREGDADRRVGTLRSSKSRSADIAGRRNPASGGRPKWIAGP